MSSSAAARLFAKRQKLIGDDTVAEANRFSEPSHIQRTGSAIGALARKAPPQQRCFQGATFRVRSTLPAHQWVAWSVATAGSALPAQDGADSCITDTGQGRRHADKWIVSSVTFHAELGPDSRPLSIAKRRHYAPVDGHRPIRPCSPCIWWTNVRSPGQAFERGGLHFEGLIGSRPSLRSNEGGTLAFSHKKYQRHRATHTTP